MTHTVTYDIQFCLMHLAKLSQHIVDQSLSYYIDKSFLVYNPLVPISCSIINVSHYKPCQLARQLCSTRDTPTPITSLQLHLHTIALKKRKQNNHLF